MIEVDLKVKVLLDFIKTKNKKIENKKREKDKIRLIFKKMMIFIEVILIILKQIHFYHKIRYLLQ